MISLVRPITVVEAWGKKPKERKWSRSVMSDSLRPLVGLKPDKNTGVGCHFLLQEILKQSLCSVLLLPPHHSTSSDLWLPRAESREEGPLEWCRYNPALVLLKHRECHPTLIIFFMGAFTRTPKNDTSCVGLKPTRLLPVAHSPPSVPGTLTSSLQRVSWEAGPWATIFLRASSTL